MELKQQVADLQGAVANVSVHRTVKAGESNQQIPMRKPGSGRAAVSKACVVDVIKNKPTEKSNINGTESEDNSTGGQMLDGGSGGGSRRGLPDLEVGSAGAAGLVGNKAGNVHGNLDLISSGSGHSENEWQLKQRKKRVPRKRPEAVTGCAKTSDLTIKAAPKKACLYVSRLMPETNCDDVVSYLGQHFPEVKCEKAQAKFPDLYSSFIITIYSDNIKAAMNPEIWPCGAYIGRFFQRKATQPVNK